VEGEVMKQILFMDDDPKRAEVFLAMRPFACWVKTAQDCIDQLKYPWDEIHLDHDLNGEVYCDSSRDDCGMEVVRHIQSGACEHLKDAHFVVHTYNHIAAVLMVRCLRDNGFKAVYRPFNRPNDPIRDVVMDALSNPKSITLPGAVLIERKDQ
jgi:hypothetical protein